MLVILNHAEYIHSINNIDDSEFTCKPWRKRHSFQLESLTGFSEFTLKPLLTIGKSGFNEKSLLTTDRQKQFKQVREGGGKGV